MLLYDHNYFRLFCHLCFCCCSVLLVTFRAIETLSHEPCPRAMGIDRNLLQWNASRALGSFVRERESERERERQRERERERQRQRQRQRQRERERERVREREREPTRSTTPTGLNIRHNCDDDTLGFRGRLRTGRTFHTRCKTRLVNA